MGRRKPTVVERNRQQILQEKRRREEEKEDETQLNALLQNLAGSSESNGTLQATNDDLEDDEVVIKTSHKKQKQTSNPDAKSIKFSHRDTWLDKNEILRLSFRLNLSNLMQDTIIQEHVDAVEKLEDHDEIDLELLEDNETLRLVNPTDSTKIIREISVVKIFEKYPTVALDLKLLALKDLVSINLKRHIDSSTVFHLLLGIAWKKYIDLTYTAESEYDYRRPRQQVQQAMHRLMLWYFYQSKQSFSEQWQMAYPEEIDALYERFVLRYTQSGQPAEPTFDVSQIYSYMETFQKNLVAEKHAQEEEQGHETKPLNENLLPTLRQYQQDAVEWMMAREQHAIEPYYSISSSSSSTSKACSTLVHFESFPVVYDLFYARFWSIESTAIVESGKCPPETSPLHLFDPFSIRGGILADEMGLGKTVEVIALVLNHPMPENESFNSSTLMRLPTIEVQKVGEQQEEEEKEEEVEDELACICGSMEEHADGWVQCDYCKTWHHQICVGYSKAVNTVQDVEKDSADAFFMCFHCQNVHHPIVSCKTTLIVSPEAIHDQWESELRRHVKPDVLRLIRYPGIKTIRQRLEKRQTKNKPNEEWQILSNRFFLAQYDIVLTTYEALQQDLYFQSTKQVQERRASTRQVKKKYPFIRSPLVGLNFWRLCMDEAQVGVENVHVQAAMMVSQLKSQYKWIVTGTPFSEQWRDLYGTLKFLQTGPFMDVFFFTQILVFGQSQKRLKDLFSFCSVNNKNKKVDVIMWRTHKRNVLDQLNLPSQQIQVVNCMFSQVERHFYQQQEQKTKQLLKEQQQQKRPLAEQEVVVEGQLWHHLLILRQACCHPQVGSHGFGSITTTRTGGHYSNPWEKQQPQGLGQGRITSNRRRGRKWRGRRNHHPYGRGRRLQEQLVDTTSQQQQQPRRMYLTMDEFLQELIMKTQRECEEAQRKLVAAQNGLCALLLIEGNLQDALLKYVSSLHLMRTNWHLFKADLLPRLHVLENLCQFTIQYFDLPSSSQEEEEEEEEEEEKEEEVYSVHETNPKEYSLLPKMPTLVKLLSTQDGQLTHDELTKNQLVQECTLLRQSAVHIRQFYLTQVNVAHQSAFNKLQSVSTPINQQLSLQDDKGVVNTKKKVHLLCNDFDTWSDLLAWIEMSTKDQGLFLMDKIRAKLYSLSHSSKWAEHFCHQFTTIRGFRMVFVQELSVLCTKRQQLFNQLNKWSLHQPNSMDISISGNCQTCREAKDGQICPHCHFYAAFENYRFHLLGIDHTLPMTAKKKKNNNVSTLNSQTSGQQLYSLHDDAEEDNENDNENDDDESHTGTMNSTTMALSSSSPSLIVDILKEIISFAKHLVVSTTSHSHYRAPPLLSIQEMDTLFHAEFILYTRLLKEWKSGKKLFQVQHHRLGAFDELEMALFKIRLKEKSEQNLSLQEKHYILEPFEIPIKFTQFQSDRVLAEQELQHHMAQLRYLKHLQPSTTTDTQVSTCTSTSSTCMVCLEQMYPSQQQPRLPRLPPPPPQQTQQQQVVDVSHEKTTSSNGHEQMILPCAHSFCRGCVNKLLTSSKQKIHTQEQQPQKTTKVSFKCPTCRRTCTRDQVSIIRQPQPRPQVNDKSQVDDSNGGIVLKHGGNGCKIDTVVRRVLTLCKENSKVKCLLFTQWQEMVSMMSYALTQNGIKCFEYTTKKKFHSIVHLFQLCPQACVLLLPFKIGANGLNLIEATEVLLVEPLLNGSIEAQAICRVHRIGQTKPTRVHRFLVDKTVEKNIYQWQQKRLHQHQHHQSQHNNSSKKKKKMDKRTETVGEEEEEVEDNCSSRSSNEEEEEEEQVSMIAKHEKEHFTLKDLSSLLNVE